MEHPAFVEAGQEPGIEIWTIDKFEPIAYDSSKYGKFYNGDSYIVLKTTGVNNSSLSYDAHFWLGSGTSQDKKGTAAILTVTLDDMLGGRAVQHREVQGHESSLFLGYFKPAIRYLEGGTESGFNEVETNAGAEKRLLRLSGCDNMRIEEVPAEFSSVTRDHCFVLEVEHDIFVLMPEAAKATQRRKIISIANSLRDDYHNGRATIEIIDEFSSDEDVHAFFTALGSGSKEDMVDADTPEIVTRDGSTVYLYKVQLGDDQELEALNKPFKQKHLFSEDLYILDTPCSGIFIWVGKDVSPENKKSYVDTIQKYLDSKGYPSWVPVTKVSEGAECAIFKQFFQNWDVSNDIKAYISDADGGYCSDEEATAAWLIGKSAAARSYMLDDASGNLTIIRVTAEEQEDITERCTEGVPVLFTTEVCVIKYIYTNEDGAESYVLYKWAGAESKSEDRVAAYEVVAQMEEEFGDNATLVFVPQGKETKHFLNIFKGNLGILCGSKDNGYAPDNYNHNYEDTNIRLFRVEGTELGVDMRVEQVPETADRLEDDDVFILETSSAVYVQNGKESDSKEQSVALDLLKVVMKEEKEVIVFEQGEEPPEFWEALGGEPEGKEDNSGWRNAVNLRVNADRTLTAVTVKPTGKRQYEEVPSYSQEDLSDDGLYILDTCEEIVLWQGKNIPERVRMVRSDVIQEYLEDDGLGRTASSALVVLVKQGGEPEPFKKLFSSWDDGMWDNQASYDDIKNDVKAGNA